MKAMYKYELANAAGVSNNTFRRWLSEQRNWPNWGQSLGGNFCLLKQSHGFASNTALICEIITTLQALQALQHKKWQSGLLIYIYNQLHDLIIIYKRYRPLFSLKKRCNVCNVVMFS